VETLVQLAQDAADRWPGRVFLHFDETGEALTFDVFDRRTDAIAAALTSHGVGKGDRVLVASGNDALFPLAWFGILKAGAIMAPLNINYTLDEARHVVALAQPKAAICDAPRAPLIAALAKEFALSPCIAPRARGKGWLSFEEVSRPDTLERSRVGVASTPDDLTNLQFTSGTSGLPKACMLTHRYWNVLATAVREAVIDLDSDDVILTAQAFSYLDPQWMLVLAMSTGARLVVLDRFRPSRLWDKIVEHDASFFYCLAAMPLMLLSSAPGPSERKHRLRVVMCSAIPADRHSELERRFHVPWVEAYGSTETGSDLGVLAEDRMIALGSGSIGKPLAHREAMIVDDALRPLPDDAAGELLVRGRGMMSGYWRDPEATAAAFHEGWYRTGDIARRDVRGFYHLVGRRKDMIRRGGENIAAAEVEAAIHQHPAVVVAACVATPDPVRNEEVRAFVVRCEAVTAHELVEFLKPRLARFKIPRYWSFVPALPMTPSERVAKPLLPRELDANTIDVARPASEP